MYIQPDSIQPDSYNLTRRNKYFLLECIADNSSASLRLAIRHRLGSACRECILSGGGGLLLGFIGCCRRLSAIGLDAVVADVGGVGEGAKAVA